MNRTIDVKVSEVSLGLISILVIPLLLIAGCGAKSDYSCSTVGQRQTRTLVRVLNFKNQYSKAHLSYDCDSSGKAGIELQLNGVLSSSLDSGPGAMKCEPVKVATYFPDDYSLQYRCTLASIEFALGFGEQSPARVRKDGFSITGYARVLIE